MGLFVKNKGDKKPKTDSPPPVSTWAGQVRGTPGAPKSYLGGSRRSQTVASATPLAAMAPTTIDTEFSADIEQQLGTVPAPKGFDVFLAALDSLGKYIPDESNRYKAAMESASPSGLTPGQIVDTLQARLELLRQIQTNFQAELEAEASEKVAEREQQLKALATQIDELDRQIKSLQKEKQDLTDDQRDLQVANAQVEQQKAQVTGRFQSAHTAHLSTTQELLQKVRQHLGQ